MPTIQKKNRAPRNRTLYLDEMESCQIKPRLVSHSQASFALRDVLNRTIHGNLFDIIKRLPSHFCHLIIADPPYNLSKDFNGVKFKKTDTQSYADWLRLWLPEMKRLLKPSGSIYVCGDWNSTSAIQSVLEESFTIRNRITWEREKGRGAKSNWKNASEDIWFATVSDDFTFHVDRVMLKRKIIAPYRNEAGEAKDWNETGNGNFRLTHPSNLWTDISVPFWSMPENTDHPTQKPEKLLAKMILASSEEGDIVFDPFLGSGTTSVVAKKLGRQYCGVEINEEYCCLAEKRLELAESDSSIQGYNGGVFWERNTLNEQGIKKTDGQNNNKMKTRNQKSFFE